MILIKVLGTIFGLIFGITIVAMISIHTYYEDGMGAAITNSIMFSIGIVVMMMAIWNVM